MSFLIAGGELDPNLDALSSAGKELGADVIELRHGPKGCSSFSWDLASNKAYVEDRPCQPKGAFVRHDVFAGLHDSRPVHNARAYGWYQAVNGWILANEEIKVFNRDPSASSANKPATLLIAEKVGLAIPKTILTNLESTIGQSASEDAVVKPVGGGEYCYLLSDVIHRTEFKFGRAACPALIQNHLVGPEIRIYVVGSDIFSFQLNSESLDYRIRQDVEIKYIQGPPMVVECLKLLMQELQMNYGAADFKTDAETGDLVFLELNSSPMFARFNLECKGALCRAMVNQLCF